MTFYKYHGTGNDFILFDNRDGKLSFTKEQVEHLCHRRFGIGADGLMFLETAAGYDFKMVYYNSDGKQSSMCGNGGRCITAFAKQLGVIDNAANFIATDGPHTSTVNSDGTINLQMNDVAEMDINNGYTILNTGSPHYVLWVPDIRTAEVFIAGRSIRNQMPFQPDGINVNFVQREEGKLLVRTYERGVEDETYSCGTGVTAAAIAATGRETGSFVTNIETRGGNLKVSFTKDTPLSAKNVTLIGPTAFVYRGEFDL